MSTDTKVAKRGRPADPGKRDILLEVASSLFMAQGFNTTTMEQIATEAGMSKLTIYRHFPDKNAIFIEVMACRSQEYAPDALFDVFYTKSPREALYTVGMAMYSLLLSDGAINLYRIMAAEAKHNPELTRMFYERGPSRVRRLLNERMRLLNDSGALKIEDPEQATVFFLSLLKGSELYMRTLLNIAEKPSENTMHKHVEGMVDFFLAAYANKAP